MITTPNLNGVLIWTLAIAALVCAIQPAHAKTSERQRRIVLIAGSKSHGPGMHEYLKSARLLKVLLDRAPGFRNVRTEVVYDGWPSEVSYARPGPIPARTSEVARVQPG